MKDSKIEWCDHTVNFWWGCTKVSPGCAHCYADSLSKRFGKDVWGPGKPREDHRAGAIKLAMRLNREAKGAARRPRVFCSSMADWLDADIPPVEWLADMLDTIRKTPNIDWLLLTKRPENFVRLVVAASVIMLRDVGESGDKYSDAAYSWVKNWLHGRHPANVWIGITVEDQQRADERIPELLQIPARVRFLSCEPLLGLVDLMPLFEHRTEARNDTGIHWVICGGESGPHARPMNPEWSRSLRDQCKAAGVPFFMKQMGGTRKPFTAIPEDLEIKEFPI